MPNSPLPPCRSTLNCYAESRSYDWDPALLLEAATAAVKSLSGFTIGRATHVTQDSDGLGLRSVFRVFLFDDDLHLRIEPADAGSVLHVRSASRVGKGDIGTNRRRVEALLDCIDDA